MRKHHLTIIFALLFIFNIELESKTDNVNYFADMKSGSSLRNTEMKTTYKLSFESQVYALDMLYKSDKISVQDRITYYNDKLSTVTLDGFYITLFYDSIIEIFTGIPNYYLSKFTKTRGLFNNYENKYGLIIDISKKKYIDLRVSTNNQCTSYYQNVDRKEISNYLLSLKPVNKKYILSYIQEAASYFGNKEFYCAYSDYLSTKSNKNFSEIVNYYLLGGDFIRASTHIEKAKDYSNAQKIYVYEKAGNYKTAYEIYLIDNPKQYSELLRLALLAQKYDEAIIFYQKYIKSSDLVKAYISADNNNNQVANHILNAMSDSLIYRLVSTYSENENYLKAYTIAKKKLSTDKELLKTLSSKASVDIVNNKLDSNFDAETLLIDAERFEDAFNYLVTKGLHLRAVEVSEMYPNIDYKNLKNTYIQAAEQLVNNNETNQNTANIIILYVKAEEWNKAGYYTAQTNDYFKALEYYKKADIKDLSAISHLYEKTDNYIEAINYQIAADSTAYIAIAKLYEKAKNYKMAVDYFIKAHDYNNAIISAELIEPKDLTILADTYYAAKDNQKLLNVLDELYLKNPSLAGIYYKKTDNLYIYKDKLVALEKYKEALDLYDINDKYYLYELNMLIDLANKANDRTKRLKLSNAKLTLLNERINKLTLDELDSAIKLSSDINNNKMKQKFIAQKNKEKARIIKEGAERHGDYVYFSSKNIYKIAIYNQKWFLTVMDENSGEFVLDQSGYLVDNALYLKNGELYAAYYNGKIILSIGIVFERYYR